MRTHDHLLSSSGDPATGQPPRGNKQHSASLKVIVLGAGASVPYGCPAARDVLKGMSLFADALKTNPWLQGVVRRTVDLMGRSGSSTCDEFVYKALSGNIDEILRSVNQKVPVIGLRYGAVNEAKIATNALFLSLESTALASGLRGYKDLITEIIASSDPLPNALRSSEYRVLSFNYDRLFEHAFKGFCNALSTSPFYGPSLLNAGLPAEYCYSLQFKEGFSFLKLHGSAGMIACDDVVGCGVEYKSGERSIRDGAPIGFNENDYIEQRGDKMVRIAEPLIAFPYEKDHILKGKQSELRFKDYIEKVWNQAGDIMRHASHVRFIGFSFAPMDKTWVDHLIAGLAPGTPVIIQNLPQVADQLCAKFRLDYPALKDNVAPFSCSF